MEKQNQQQIIKSQSKVPPIPEKTENNKIAEIPNRLIYINKKKRVKQKKQFSNNILYKRVTQIYTNRKYKQTS